MSEKSLDRAMSARRASTQHNRDLKTAYEKAIELMEDERFDMADFADLYGESVVATDIARVEQLKATIARQEAGNEDAQESKRLALILEGIISDQIYDSMWFGEGVESRPTSEFDDLVNGIDLVTIFDVEGKARTHLGLAIDVTFSNYPSKKVKRILEEIRTGRMPSIKYYEDDITRGEVKQVPRVLLAVSNDNTRRAAETWVQDKQGLADSPMKAQLAMQIVGQLGLYRDFARTLPGREDIADLYDRQLRIFEGQIQNLGLDALRQTPEAVEHFFTDADNAHRGLLRELESQFSEVF